MCSFTFTLTVVLDQAFGARSASVKWTWSLYWLWISPCKNYHLTESWHL